MRALSKRQALYKLIPTYRYILVKVGEIVSRMLSQQISVSNSRANWPWPVYLQKDIVLIVVSERRSWGVREGRICSEMRQKRGSGSEGEGSYLVGNSLSQSVLNLFLIFT
jgi:hypothetical protein